MVFFKKKKKDDKVSGLPPDMVYSMEPRHGHAQDVVDENGIRQVAGCLPIDPINKRFLLVTSSSNPGTWVIPKGGWEQDETQQQAAMRETWEEAGVKGNITRHVGVFAEKNKGVVKAHHWVYELEIKEVTKKFPEQKKRDRRWFSYDEAMLVVKASYIKDALGMSSLSPLIHPNCESLQSDGQGNKKKEKKKKKKESDSDSEDVEKEKKKKEKKKNKSSDEEELSEEQKEEKRQKKLEKKLKQAENSEEDDDEEKEKKKKKKKKEKKKGEITELNEDELPPMYNTTPLGKVDVPVKSSPIIVEEKILAPLNQQLRQTHISPERMIPQQNPLYQGSPPPPRTPPIPQQYQQQQQQRPQNYPPQQQQHRPPPPQQQQYYPPSQQRPPPPQNYHPQQRPPPQQQQFAHQHMFPQQQYPQHQRPPYPQQQRPPQ